MKKRNTMKRHKKLSILSMILLLTLLVNTFSFTSASALSPNGTGNSITPYGTGTGSEGSDSMIFIGKARDIIPKSFITNATISGAAGYGFAKMVRAEGCLTNIASSVIGSFVGLIATEVFGAPAAAIECFLYIQRISGTLNHYDVHNYITEYKNDNYWKTVVGTYHTVIRDQYIVR